MRAPARSARNTVKNIALLVLVAMLCMLCAANWVLGMNIAQMPADNLLRRAYDHLVGGAVGYELRSSGVAAAEPAQLALRVDGQLYGVQYNLTEVEAAFSAVQTVWERRCRTVRSSRRMRPRSRPLCRRATAPCCAIMAASRCA